MPSYLSSPHRHRDLLSKHIKGFTGVGCLHAWGLTHTFVAGHLQSKLLHKPRDDHNKELYLSMSKVTMNAVPIAAIWPCH